MIIPWPSNGDQARGADFLAEDPAMAGVHHGCGQEG